jgi:hypothetical protein
MLNWIKQRIGERSTLSGLALVVLGVLVLFLAPLAKIAAGLAILYGLWEIWNGE